MTQALGFIFNNFPNNIFEIKNFQRKTLLISRYTIIYVYHIAIIFAIREETDDLSLLLLSKNNNLHIKTNEHICIFSLDHLARSHHKPKGYCSPQYLHKTKNNTNQRKNRNTGP